MGVRVTDRDRGARRLLRSVERGHLSVKVGVFDRLAATAHPGSDLTVGEVAVIQELGTSTIPSRSFVREPIDRHKRAIVAEAGKVLLRSSASDLAERAGVALGTKGVEVIEDAIDSNIPPPNAPSTVARKGSSHTLIDTGLLRQSVSFKVKVGR